MTAMASSLLNSFSDNQQRLYYHRNLDATSPENKDSQTKTETRTIKAVLTGWHVQQDARNSLLTTQIRYYPLSTHFIQIMLKILSHGTDSRVHSVHQGCQTYKRIISYCIKIQTYFLQPTMNYSKCYKFWTKITSLSYVSFLWQWVDSNRSRKLAKHGFQGSTVV